LPTTVLEEGMILYLQPKRKKADVRFSTHTVEEGETMHHISQKFAIKLSKLIEMNQLSEGTEPAPGDLIRLR
jgi:LysM repeat protein